MGVFKKENSKVKDASSALSESLKSLLGDLIELKEVFPLN